MYTMKFRCSMEQGLQMYFADGALSSHLFSDEIEDSSSGSSGSLMKLKGFVLALCWLDICYQINHSIKHITYKCTLLSSR
jgi:hypothetical protein